MIVSTLYQWCKKILRTLIVPLAAIIRRTTIQIPYKRPIWCSTACRTTRCSSRSLIVSKWIAAKKISSQMASGKRILWQVPTTLIPTKIIKRQIRLPRNEIRTAIILIILRDYRRLCWRAHHKPHRHLLPRKNRRRKILHRLSIPNEYYRRGTKWRILSWVFWSPGKL